MALFKEHIDEIIDGWLTGLAVGLYISIVTVITFTTVGNYKYDKAVAEMQAELDAEFEQHRLELEGFDEN